MQEAKDESLVREFYIVKHMLQTVLESYDPESADLGFAERYAKLVETAIAIKERRAKLRLMIGPGESNRKLEFTDPWVQLVLKEKFRDAHLSAVRGTVALIFKVVAGDPELTKRLFQSLPERFRQFVSTDAISGNSDFCDQLEGSNIP